STPSYGETSADDYFLLPATIKTLDASIFDWYTWKKTRYVFGKDWNKAYLCVYNANLALELLDKVERNTGNAADWDNVKGSALFYRSFYYLALNVQYGLGFDESSSASDLGIVIRESSDFNQVSVRSSVKTCYQKVVADLEQSLNFLPDNPRHTFRPSKAAAYALLARTGLYLHDYAMALKYADLALKIKSDLMDFNGDTDLNLLTANVPVKRFNKETIFYTEMSTGFDLHAPYSGMADTVLYAAYSINDLRRTAFFRASGKYQIFKGNYTGNANTMFTGLATDEVYLTRAESKAFLGDVSGAMADLNLLIKKRWRSSVAYVPFTAASVAEALNIIRQERRKELTLRGLRFGDIKRYNKETAGIVLSRLNEGQLYRLEPNSSFYALPLPQDLIERSGIEQN
ncbi:MAG: RagB/SusD family nutrient uptake outer membrane protein, partial [Chitinophagaceae bacterium]